MSWRTWRLPVAATDVTRASACASMKRVPGLILLFVCTYTLSFYMRKSLRCAFNSNPQTNHAAEILGQYRVFRAELGLLQVPSNIHQSSSHSFRVHVSPPLIANNIPLAHRIETASLTSGLNDEPEHHHHGIRKMLRRTPTFGLHLSIHSFRPPGGSHSIPAHSEIENRSPPPLHFAVDSIREPRTSSEHVLREYSLLSVRESNMDNVDTVAFTKSGTSNSKSKTSPKEKSSLTSRASARASPGRRSRGRRRHLSHVEH